MTFQRLYYSIIFQSLLNIPNEYYRKQLINRLSTKQQFDKFVQYQLDQSDRQMAQQLKQYYQEDREAAIRNAYAWKSLTLKSDYYIQLDYQIQKDYSDATTVIFHRYNVKTGTIQKRVFLVEGRSRAIFYSMFNRNQNAKKMYYTLRKYGQCLL